MFWRVVPLYILCRRILTRPRSRQSTAQNNTTQRYYTPGHLCPFFFLIYFFTFCWRKSFVCFFYIFWLFKTVHHGQNCHFLIKTHMTIIPKRNNLHYLCMFRSVCYPYLLKKPQWCLGSDKAQLASPKKDKATTWTNKSERNKKDNIFSVFYNLSIKINIYKKKKWADGDWL